MVDGNRYPTGRQVAPMFDALVVVGAVKSYAGKARFYGRPGGQPIENLPLSAHPDDLKTNRGVAIKNAIARVNSIFARRIVEVAPSQGHGQPTNLDKAPGTKPEPQA
jgi:hypothetical protein